MRYNGRMENVHGKRALVVGGTSGIGLELAEALHERGAIVTVTGTHEGGRIRASGIKFLRQRFTLCNIMRPLHGKFRAALDSSQIACVCYGPFIQNSMSGTTPQEWRSMALFNYALPGIILSRLLAAMKKNGGGSIMVFGGTRTSSVNAFKTNAAYAGAKTGLSVLVKSAAQEGAPHGIRCNAVMPGFVTCAPRGARLQSARYVAEAALELLLDEEKSGVLLDLA